MREVRGGVVADEAGVPAGQVLGVGLVQGLELPETVAPGEHPVRESHAHAGAHLVRAGEHGAEHREVEGDLAHAQVPALLGEGGHHGLVHAVGGLGGAAHQVQGQSTRAPRDEGLQGHDLPGGVPHEHGHAAPVRAVREPVQGHGEAAVRLVPAPLLGELDDLLHGGGVQLAVALHGDGAAGLAHTGHSALDRAHRAALERERVGVQDGLVTERAGPQTGLHICLGAGLGGGQHPHPPGVLAPPTQPRGNRVLPRVRVAQRIAGRQADGADHPVGHGRTPVCGEDHGLVPAGGEVPQRVLAAVRCEEPTDVQLLLGAQDLGPLGGLREPPHGEEKHRGTQDAAQRGQPVGARGAVRDAAGQGQARDAAEGEPQVLDAVQVGGDQPGDREHQRGDQGQTAQQGEQCLPGGAAARAGGEVAPADDERDDPRRCDDEPHPEQEPVQDLELRLEGLHRQGDAQQDVDQHLHDQHAEGDHPRDPQSTSQRGPHDEQAQGQEQVGAGRNAERGEDVVHDVEPLAPRERDGDEGPQRGQEH